MHSLHNCHTGPSLYGPGGIGWREYDLTPHLIGSEEIVAVRDLPGFVLGNTTYESHHFWVHFARYVPRNPNVKKSERYSSVYIRVNHGAGWEVWSGDYMLAESLRRYGDDDIGLFLLCWYLIDNARSARAAGREAAATEYRQAFVDGRLKKRKLPAQGKVKVWIEPKIDPTQPLLDAGAASATA